MNWQKLIYLNDLSMLYNMSHNYAYCKNDESCYISITINMIYVYFKYFHCFSLTCFVIIIDFHIGWFGITQFNILFYVKKETSGVCIKL